MLNNKKPQEVGDLVRALRQLDQMREAANAKYLEDYNLAVFRNDPAEVARVGQVHRLACKYMNEQERKIRISQHEYTPAPEGYAYTTNGSCSWGSASASKYSKGALLAQARRMDADEERLKILDVKENLVPAGGTGYVRVGEKVVAVRFRTRDENRELTDRAIAEWHKSQK